MIKYFTDIKILLLLLFVVTVISACDGFMGSGNSNDQIEWDGDNFIVPGPENRLSEEQKTLYRKDAEKLAVRHINQIDSAQVEIPEDLINLLYNGLVHIATSDHTKAREATEEYSIHARTPSRPREIRITTEPTAPWIDSWRNGTTETGNPKIDSLINEFDLILTEYAEFDHLTDNGIATLKSNRALNGSALGRQLKEQSNYIQDAGFINLVGDGSEIHFLFFDNRLRYTFDYGFGDCPSGCISRHQWTFDVYKDGTVTFVSEEGDALE